MKVYPAASRCICYGDFVRWPGVLWHHEYRDKAGWENDWSELSCRFLLKFLPILSGCHAGGFPEYPDEIAAAGETGLLCDELHVGFCFQEQLFCPFYAGGGQIIGEISGKMLLEIHAEIFGRHMKPFSQCFQGKVLPAMILNILGDMQEHIHLPGIFFTSADHAVFI